MTTFSVLSKVRSVENTDSGTIDEVRDNLEALESMWAATGIPAQEWIYKEPRVHLKKLDPGQELPVARSRAKAIEPIRPELSESVSKSVYAAASIAIELSTEDLPKVVEALDAVTHENYQPGGPFTIDLGTVKNLYEATHVDDVTAEGRLRGAIAERIFAGLQPELATPNLATGAFEPAFQVGKNVLNIMVSDSFAAQLPALPAYEPRHAVRG